ncbi:MAG: site-specific DNA-methyltransferase [Gemmataceae bacterium]|nr:site-specific DNA-methyltransferase [Gemmataceae bacterium]
MATKFDKLKSLLRELFQLDQPDLDFGLYRIMHAKAAEVTAFLEKDLLPQVKAEFGQYKTADKAELQKELDKAIEQAHALGADPETLPKVKDLRAKLQNEAVDIAGLENDVYDHLLSFFSRYYSDGDFVSKRKYSRDGKYAIPYDGEEVKLYWANHDQYYIKTSEYLRDYAFRLRPEDDTNPLRVHFQLVDAAEGEHGNVKAAAGKDRVFILAAANPVFLEADELVCRFEYRPATLTDWPDDVRSGKTKPPTQKDLTAIAEARILERAGSVSDGTWLAELAKPHVKADGEKAEYNRLRAHLNRYVGRNTFDYFIHKDLGGFLKRELDFFIKNEVMMLDDIENETAPRVEQYLSKIKVIRRIAGKIIAFLAQLEDFQRALWLKKKFVVETQYCVALKEIARAGSVSDGLLKEIAANKAQQAEWNSLGFFALKDDADGLFSSSSNSAIRIPHSALVDTRHFDADFTARLLAALGDLDAKTDGVLFHSENFQALNLMQARYKERVKCVYIDPPYNTGNDGFAYKDSYQHSTWLSMMGNRSTAVRGLLSDEATLFMSIDETEAASATTCISATGIHHITNIIWQKVDSPNDNKVPMTPDHEYLLCFSTELSSLHFNAMPDPSILDSYRKNEATNELYRDRLLKKNGAGSLRIDRPTMYFPIIGPDGEAVYPMHDNGVEARWSLSQLSVAALQTANKLIWKKRIVANVERWEPYTREFAPDVPTRPYPTIWTDVNTMRQAKAQATALFGTLSTIETVKPVELITRVSRMAGSQHSTILDFFAGSGTTGHAVINLNREDGGRRKVILVEMADYFDTVLLPRLKKVAFTPEWKDGQPKRLATAEEAERGPRVFKIVRLESYEDTLNNLELKRSPGQQSLLDAAEAQGADKLREQYLLQYLLKVESRESPSLLNVAAFTDPTAYKLVVKRPGSDESREVNIDLLETFNWLLGLTVTHIAVPQVFTAEFKRNPDPAHKKEENWKLTLDGRLKPDAAGPYWFRTVTGTTPDGRKALVIWRKLTGKPEEDNLVLDEWFTKQGYSSKDSEFGLIYVNGGNNLENLKTPDDTWKVRLIEDDFQRLMFAAEGV